MPRGRPSIQRTKEEAKIARRAQVRRNVQTYRRRKHSSSRSGESQTPPKELCRFVLEQWGQQNSPRLQHVRDLDAPLEQQYDLTKHDRGRRLVSHSGKSKIPSKVNKHSTMFKNLADIPPESLLKYLASSSHQTLLPFSYRRIRVQMPPS